MNISGEVELPPLKDCEINLKYEVQFPNMPALPYRVVYNGNSLMSICSDTDKVVVALPPEIPEGRHTYFQSEERESKGMQFMVYAANRHQALTNALKQRESELLSALREKEQEITRLAEAVVHIAVAAKVTNGDLPMTGPQVLLIASDCVSAFEAAERTIADLRAEIAITSAFPEPSRIEGKHRFMAGTCVDCGHPLDEICTANLPPITREEQR